MAQPQPIEHFGKYQILERVARGGMAEIYKARMEGIGGFNRLFAIKRILPNLSQNREYVDLLVDEAKIAGLLSHANIVQILDLGQVTGQYYVAMEYVHGRDLGRVLHRCRERGITLPVPHSVFILIEVLKGLEYAHNRQIMRGNTPMPLEIIHRDVSPSNVLVSFQGEVKLTDFGIAKARVKAMETVSGVIKGKFDYMSPEQASGADLDQRSDLFATGVLLYEMLCGRHPFRRRGDLQTIDAIKAGQYSPPTFVNSDVPYSLEVILDRALARGRADRFQTATEFKDALTKFFHDSGFIFSHSTLAAFLKGLFPEATPRRKPKETEQQTRPMPRPPLRSVDDQVATVIQPDDSLSLEPLTLDEEASHDDPTETTGIQRVLDAPRGLPTGPADDSRNFGPALDVGEESTLLRPGAKELVEAAERAREAAEWADEVETQIRRNPLLDDEDIEDELSLHGLDTEELDELVLDDPTGSIPMPRPAPPPPPPAPAAPQPAPASQPPTPGPYRPTQRTIRAIVLVGVLGFCVGSIFGVAIGVLGSQRYADNNAPLAVTAAPKVQPRVVVAIPEGASLTVNGRELSVPPGESVEVTLEAGKESALVVSAEGYAPLEHRLTLDHNEERALRFDLAQLEPRKR